ncbi:MAG: addiction module protein [Ignavibacteriales bacterium]|nr:addiction module protein [Ignavibacteriales bacterium]
MTNNTQKILSEALELQPIERAELVEELLSSFEFPLRVSIDELWSLEAEDRISAFDKGKLAVIPAKEVFEKIGKH